MGRMGHQLDEQKENRKKGKKREIVRNDFKNFLAAKEEGTWNAIAQQKSFHLSIFVQIFLRRTFFSGKEVFLLTAFLSFIINLNSNPKFSSPYFNLVIAPIVLHIFRSLK